LNSDPSTDHGISFRNAPSLFQKGLWTVLRLHLLRAAWIGVLAAICSAAARQAVPPLCRRFAARRVSAAASSKPADFDEFLMMVAEKFEKVDNKPVVVG
jgi:hypothetical protein